MPLPLTRWTVIDAAREGDEQAFQQLVERYRPPVISYLRRRGLAADAEDLAQEVFLRLFHKGVLERADPGKGRFRNLILAVARNVVSGELRKQHTLKRGGGEGPEALGEREVASPVEEETFDREWLSNLLSRSLGRLAGEQPRHYEVLRRFLLEEQSYAEITAALGCSKGDVNNLIYRGKRKLAAYLREEVRIYAGTGDEYRTELELFARMLPI